MHRRCCLPAASSVRNYRPKEVELIEIINKPLLLHLVGYLYYWKMGFNSVFKGLITKVILRCTVRKTLKKTYSSKSQFHICNMEQHNDPVNVTVALIPPAMGRLPWEYRQSWNVAAHKRNWGWTKLLNSLAVGLQRLTKSLTCASHGKDEKHTQNLPRKPRKEERLKVDRRIRD